MPSDAFFLGDDDGDEFPRIQLWEADDDETHEWDGGEPDLPTLGACCACGQDGPTVRNIMMLDFRAPVAGTGWGCIVCGLPSDGAIAVLCDACAERNAEIRDVCVGQPGDNVRTEIKTVQQPFGHDLSKHVVIPDYYSPQLGAPLYWRNEPSGLLAAAVMAMHAHGADPKQPGPSAEQLGMIARYAQYYINAPCWDIASEVFATELAQLRAQAKAMKTLADVQAWIGQCLNIGVDPF